MNKALEKVFPVFCPNSANFDKYPELTFLAANIFPKQIYDLLKQCKSDINEDVITIDDFCRESDDNRLGALFNSYGSDKTIHGHSRIYSRIFDLLNRDNLSIFEIGIGTNNPNAISTMGVYGKPGASLRAFRDYSNDFFIYGADIDRNILFTEERIQTTFIDQTKFETYSEALNKFNKSSFDVIIDDGLHSPLSNINTLIFGLNVVKNGGYIVIEDIPFRCRSIWDIIRNILPGEFVDTYLIARGQNSGGYVFVVHVRKNYINGKIVDSVS